MSDSRRMLQGKELIEREERKKARARENSKRYRANKKRKFEEDGKIDEYRMQKADAMRKYRALLQERLLNAYVEIGNPKQQAQRQQQIQPQINFIQDIVEDRQPQSKRQQQQSKLKGAKNPVKPFKEAQKKDRKTTRSWMSKLPKGKLNYTEEEIQKAKFLDEEARKKLIVIIDKIFRLILNKTLDPEVKKMIDKVYRGQNLTDSDMKILRGTNKPASEQAGLYFLTKDKIEGFVKKIRERYPNLNSFKAQLQPITNILSRLPVKEWDDIYQYVSLTATEASEEVLKEKKSGITSEEDARKIFDFSTVEDVMKTKLTKDITPRLNVHYIRALAAVYGLQLPRRIKDYEYMVLDDTPITSINTLSKDKNYLLIDSNKNPQTFVFNVYKTQKQFQQQVINISSDNLKRYLKNHIIHSKLRVGNYIFGSHNFNSRNTGLGKDLSTVFTLMYGAAISSRFIRSSAANDIWDKATSIDEIERAATEMAHDPMTNLSYRKNVGSMRVQKELKEKEKEKEKDMERRKRERENTQQGISSNKQGK